jgi:hypothetical protein
MNFFTQVRHRYCGQTAQRQAHQGASNQDAFPGRHHRAEQGKGRRRKQRKHHDGLAPKGIGNRSGDQQTNGQHRRGDRQDQTALCRVDPVFMGQHRHHRLHTIQQRKGRKAPREQRQHRAHKHRRAFLDKHIIELRDNIIQRGWRDFVGERCNSSFHGDLKLR